MFCKTVLLVSLMMILAAFPVAAESVEGLPLHVQKIEPGVVRVWVGDHVSSTAVSRHRHQERDRGHRHHQHPQAGPGLPQGHRPRARAQRFQVPDQHPRPRRPHHRQRRLRRLPDHRPRERQGHDGGEFQAIIPRRIEWNKEYSQGAEGADSLQASSSEEAKSGRQRAADHQHSDRRIPELLAQAHLPHQDLQGQAGPGLRRRHASSCTRAAAPTPGATSSSWSRRRASCSPAT